MEKNISMIEQNNGRQLVYETDNKNKNDVAINFAKNNDIPHLAEMQIEEGDGLKGTYMITDCIPVMKSVSAFPGRDEVFTLIKKIIYVLEELRESFIRESDLLFNKDYIFIDQKSDVIKFILTPEIQEEKVTIKEFIEDILVTTSWKKIEYKSYLNVLAAAISRSDVTYNDIIDVINKELENPVQYHTIEIPPDENIQDAKSNDISKEVETIEETNVVAQTEDNIQQQLKEAQNPIDVKQPQPPVQPLQLQSPVQLVQPQSPVQPLQPQPPVQSVPPQAAPIQPMFSPVPPMAVSQIDNDSQFGETTVLSDQFGETTVLGTSIVPAVCPILTRIKTGEKVVINKTEFYIGKDPTKVDYCRFNNSAISRVHIRIVCKNGEFFVVDNNSTNHVYVNGRRIEPDVEVRLEHDSRVRLGDEDFEFRFQ